MIKFIKLYDVKTPERGTLQSAGIDFFVPEKTSQYVNFLLEKNPDCGINNDNFTINEHSRILIPSGIKVCLPENTAFVAFNKSGIAHNKGLIFGASVVDSDYHGEILISLINTNSYPVTINFGQKIIQFVLLPVYFDNLEEVISEEILYSGTESERGDGGFGSTGVH